MTAPAQPSTFHVKQSIVGPQLGGSGVSQVHAAPAPVLAARLPATVPATPFLDAPALDRSFPLRRQFVFEDFVFLAALGPVCLGYSAHVCWRCPINAPALPKATIMPDFSQLKEETRATAVIPIEGIDGMRPELTCKPATRANKPYYNGLLAADRRGRAARGTRIKVDDVNRMISNQRELVAQYCVVSWKEGSVIDASGKPVPFSKQECLRFFNALPDRIFEAFLAEITDDVTFVVSDDGTGDDTEDATAQAGN